MFLLNHSVHQNNIFVREAFSREHTIRYREIEFFVTTRIPLCNLLGEGAMSELFFTDVTKQTGINSTAISYGLGISIADINLDGYPDIYIGNDFHENDYLYINQKNGTFKEEGEQRFMHTSHILWE
jgi:hypothetical protein